MLLLLPIIIQPKKNKINLKPKIIPKLMVEKHLQLILIKKKTKILLVRKNSKLKSAYIYQYFQEY